MTVTDIAEISAPFVAGAVGFVITRMLKNQDRERAEQTELIRNLGAEIRGLVGRFARLEVVVDYHDTEIKRFRELVDRWNKGPDIQ